MKAKRKFQYRILDIAPWVDHKGKLTCVFWVYDGINEARAISKAGTNWVEQAEFVEVYPLECSPSKCILIKASEG
jgi:hypothetical protein